MKVPPPAPRLRPIAPNVANPRDASNNAVNTCSRSTSQIGRGKMLQISRGICMTPGIRATGPSYMKPVPPPVQRVAHPAPAHEPPLVILRTIATRQEIVAVNVAALQLGIRPELTLTEARALCPKVLAFDEDPRQDARALEALARWMTRFTPFVSIPAAPPQRAGADHLPPPPDANTIYLDVTGCDRVFGGISNIVREVIHSLRRLRIDAGVAVAPHPGAAWALACFGENSKITPAEDLGSELAPLPVAALRLSDHLRQSLHHLGIETIGQLVDLPRTALPSRFGPELLLRLDQAMGRIDEPLVPLPWQAPIEARVDFDGRVDSLETIHLVFRQLIGQVVAQLARRGCGARRLEILFVRAYAQTLSHTIALSRPSRDPINLFNLIRCATENLEGGDDGFLGIRLHVPVAERISDEQIALLDQERLAGEIELAQLVERLHVRLGEKALVQPRRVESHVPERAFAVAWQGFSTRASSSNTPVEHCRNRPLQLLPEPVEIGVIVSPSQDRDGRPILFRNGSEVHDLRHTTGPERISGEWWRGHDKTRDYFDVEDASGKRFWLFRVNETGKWYVHGVF